MSGPGFSTKVLLGSGGISTEARRATYRELVGEHFSGCQSIVFVPFASDDHEHYTSRMQDFLGPGGPRLVGIHNSYMKATQDVEMGKAFQQFCDYFSSEHKLGKAQKTKDSN